MDLAHFLAVVVITAWRPQSDQGIVVMERRDQICTINSHHVHGFELFAVLHG